MQNTILGLVNPAIALLFAGAFVFLWARNRSARHVLALAAGYALLGAGFLIFHFTPDPNSALSILLMHTAYGAAILLLCGGVLGRAGIRMRLTMAIIILTISGIGMVMTSMIDSMNSRLYLANSCYGMLFALAAQVLSRSGRSDPIDKVILWLFGLTSAQFFVRPHFVALAAGTMTAAEYRSSAYYSLLIVAVAVISLMLAMALVAAVVSDQMERLKSESERDLLTGLRTRRAFERDAVAMIEAAHREEVPLTAIVADIDHFKRVNDIFGHQAGDNAIAAFGKLLVAEVRDSDCVGRIGGEEFCILVWDCDGRASTRLAERFRLAFAALEIEGMSSDLRLTASFGVAERNPGEGYGRLFARADAALYAAKDAGRNRVEASAPRRRSSDLITAAAA